MKPGKPCLAALAAIFLAVATVAGIFISDEAFAQMTIPPADALQDAQAYFGPDPSPWLATAERIARGEALKPNDLDAVSTDIDRRFKEGQFRLLVFAWQVGNIPSLEALLARSADPRAPIRLSDPSPRQDLLSLILTNDEPKAAPALQALLRHGLAANTRVAPSNSAILGKAFVGQNLSVEAVLLDSGADPWAQDGLEGSLPGQSILMTVFNLLDFKSIQLLIARGVFRGQPASRIKPIVESLANVRQSGDDTSVTIQSVMRSIVQQSSYPIDDPDVRYVLSGKP